MDRAETLAVLDAYYSAFNGQDRERVLTLFTDDAEFIDYTMGRTLKGLDQVAGFIDETWMRSPYFKLEPEDILVDGDRAASRLYMSGAPRLGNSDATPTKSDIWRIPSTSFFRFRDGKICWKADCWNMLAIPKQMGWLKTLRHLPKLRT